MTVKVFVAGATGVLGRRVVGGLVMAGHEVSGVARSRGASQLLTTLGATPVETDLFDWFSVRAAVRGHDAVINLTTSIPAFAKAARARAWSDTHRIRESVSRNLAHAARSTRVTRLVQESIVFPYPDRGDEWIDETETLAPSPHTATVTTAETAVREFQYHGGDGVVLRFGMLYSNDSEHALAMARMAMKRLSPVLGRREAFLSFVHADDAAAAAIAALDLPADTYNVVDDAPIRRADFDDLLSDCLGVARIRRLPTVTARLISPYLEVLARSQRVSNERLRKTGSWQPDYPSPVEGWRLTIGRWRDGGLLPQPRTGLSGASRRAQEDQ